MADLSKGRYVLFCMEHYYPSGGWNDVEARSDDREALTTQGMAYMKKGGSGQPHAHVIDLETGEKVWES